MPRWHQTLLLVITLLALFGWETLPCLAAWTSGNAVQSDEVQALPTEHDDGSPDDSLFRKPVVLFRSASSGAGWVVPPPLAGDQWNWGDLDRRPGWFALGSNAECRAPPGAC
jgi:hypothetical protein